jgi:alanyl-tRNA synthetase
MKSSQIRNGFLEYFRGKGHTIVPSAPLIPAGDTTLLFTNAGMNQFKDVFLGTGKREYVRVADSQKCIRVTGKHNDLEDVGKDTYHHTFFEMLGNWSFGDYYKKEAIEFAWELLTDVWKIPKEKLWASVYEEDAEAEELWRKVTDIKPERIMKFDKKHNFWEMGDIGPCGPCSEIIYDRGEEFACGPNCNIFDDCFRYLELWNLVFIQYNRNEDGSLEELPQKHIDTGMGLERLVAIMQGKHSNYDTDLFIPIIESIEETSQKSYLNSSTKEGIAFRVIADHIRALTFAITDGVIPSNEGRGYVIRRILRRAMKYARDLQLYEPFLYKLVSRVVDVMGNSYSEILERCNYVSQVIKSEEESFGKTIDRGDEILRIKVADLLKKSIFTFPGDAAFQVHDTYGYPIDLTRLRVTELGMKDVDEKGFEEEMARQKERSREKTAEKSQSLRTVKLKRKIKFKENKSELETNILKIIDDEGNSLEKAYTGSYIWVYLPETPFYGESGGQVGDQGTITLIDKKGAVWVKDTQKPSEFEIVHIGEVIEGEITIGDRVKASIDYPRRLSIMRNHTATHLLHRALRKVLGDHVRQSGSLVAPEYLRFDFNHFQKLSQEEILGIEKIVNDTIRENRKVFKRSGVQFSEAIKEGAVALFGEKYGDKVRMVEVKGYSKELCGGSHLNYTGQIGYFLITSESSIAAGMRRIEAVTGEYAEKLIKENRKILEDTKELLNVKKEYIVERINSLIEQNKNLEKQFKKAKQSFLKPEFEKILESPRDIDYKNMKIHVHSGIVECERKEELLEMGDIFRQKRKSGVGIFGSAIDKKAVFICVVTDNLIKEFNLKAGDIVSEIAKVVGGGGGGNPHMASAGAKNVEKLEEAISKSFEIVKNLLNKTL